MQLSDILAQIGGVPGLAKNLNINEDQAKSGAETLLPILLNSINAKLPAQNSLVGGLLQKVSEAGVLDQVLGNFSAHKEHGNTILEHLFGSPSGSRAVAQEAEAKSGVSSDILKQMLPVLALLATNYLTKQHSQSSSSGGVIAGLGKLFNR